MPKHRGAQCGSRFLYLQTIALIVGERRVERTIPVLVDSLHGPRRVGRPAQALAKQRLLVRRRHLETTAGVAALERMRDAVAVPGAIEQGGGGVAHVLRPAQVITEAAAPQQHQVGVFVAAFAAATTAGM